MTAHRPAWPARVAQAATIVLFGLFLAVSACQDRELQPTAPNASARAAPLSETHDAALVSSFHAGVDPALCLTATGPLENGTLTAIRPCDRSESQNFIVRSDGTIRVNDAMCLHVYREAVNEGDVGIWGCDGQRNQQWTLDHEQHVRALDGQCLTSDPHSRPGYPNTVSACASGAAQQWTVEVSDRPTTEGPTTTPTRPTGDFVNQLLGSLPSSSTSSALGGVFSQYERDFTEYDEPQWSECGPRWDCIDYYDRAAIYYARWKRTGDPKYLQRGNEVARDFRANYIEANAYGIAHNWAMMEGVGLHYAITGDPASLTAVGKVADGFAWLVRGGESGYISNAAVMDNRIQAYYIRSLLVAYLLKAPSVGVDQYGFPGGNDWAALLRKGLDEILGTRDPDGQWRGARCPQPDGSVVRATHPFTVGLLYDALIQYYELFEPDPRIPAAIEGSADVMWREDWLPESAAFKYVAIDCPGEGGPGPASDLNALIVNGYAFVGRTLSETFSQRADQIFAGAVNGRGVTGDAKHFNQQYTGSMYYLRSRAR